jgi:hypothetical protein
MHEKIADEFTKILLATFKAVPSAGSAVTVEGAKAASAILSEAVSEGAKVLVGSVDVTGRSSLEPSLLTNVNPKSRLARQESFAPSASLYVVRSDEEALEMANDTPYGLSASVFTRNHAKGLALARDLEFGQVQINGSTMRVDGKILTGPDTGALLRRKCADDQCSRCASDRTQGKWMGKQQCWIRDSRVLVLQACFSDSLNEVCNLGSANSRNFFGHGKTRQESEYASVLSSMSSLHTLIDWHPRATMMWLLLKRRNMPLRIAQFDVSIRPR